VQELWRGSARRAFSHPIGFRLMDSAILLDSLELEDHLGFSSYGPSNVDVFVDTRFQAWPAGAKLGGGAPALEHLFLHSAETSFSASALEPIFISSPHRKDFSSTLCSSKRSGACQAESKKANKRFAASISSLGADAVNQKDVLREKSRIASYRYRQRQKVNIPFTYTHAA
jgi:hypothetical protein